MNNHQIELYLYRICNKFVRAGGILDKSWHFKTIPSYWTFPHISTKANLLELILQDQNYLPLPASTSPEQQICDYFLLQHQNDPEWNNFGYALHYGFWDGTTQNYESEINKFGYQLGQNIFNDYKNGKFLKCGDCYGY